MCIEDWRLGRLIRAVPQSQVIASGTTFTILSNRQRVGLSIGSQADIDSAVGFVSISNGGVIRTILRDDFVRDHITLAQHGELPMLECIIGAAGVVAQVGIIEYFLPEEFLNAGLQDFMRGCPG